MKQYFQKHLTTCWLTEIKILIWNIYLLYLLIYLVEVLLISQAIY